MHSPQRVMIYEHISAMGVLSAEDRALLAEGQAMLSALLEDLANDDNGQWVTVLHDAKMRVPRGIRVIRSDAKTDAFVRAMADVDAVFAIAPEWDGVLINLAKQVSCLGKNWLGVPLPWIEVFSDKLATAHHLKSAIPTRLCDPWPEDSEGMVVVKPRDGVGAIGVTEGRHRDVSKFLARSGPGFLPGDWISQPFVSGDSYSIACIASADQEWIVLPTVSQRFEFTTHGVGDDSVATREYVGGTWPVPAFVEELGQQLVHELKVSSPGLTGYLGIDFIVAKEVPRRAWLVEVNPRLTTSYLAYRELFGASLAPCALGIVGNEPREKLRLPAKVPPTSIFTFDKYGKGSWSDGSHGSFLETQAE